jgi:hypothetical protein
MMRREMREMMQEIATLRERVVKMEEAMALRRE